MSCKRLRGWKLEEAMGPKRKKEPLEKGKGSNLVTALLIFLIFVLIFFLISCLICFLFFFDFLFDFLCHTGMGLSLQSMAQVHCNSSNIYPWERDNRHSLAEGA